MINTDDLCMSCMKEIGPREECPHCGFNNNTKQISPYLPIRSVVGYRYLVGKLLEYNGDGATYIAWDMGKKAPVMLREFFPDAIATRRDKELKITVLLGCENLYEDCLQSFLELWRQLMRLRGLSSLISVIDVVEDNGTAYAIYEDPGSKTLRDYLLSIPTGYLPWEKARSLFMPVLSTLGTLHSSGIIHRAISPTNLIMGDDGKLRITGFSISQIRTSNSELNPQLYPGYSALEQYGAGQRQGTWTDIYSFSAVLYRSLIGSDPIEAPTRASNDRLMVPGKFAEQLPAYVINGLVNGLQILPGDRTHTVDQLRAELSASPVAAAASTQVPQINDIPEETIEAEPVKKSQKPKQKGLTSWQVALISFFVCVFVVLGGILLIFGDDLGVFKPSGNNNEDISVTNPTTVIVPNFRADNVTLDRAKQILGDAFVIKTVEKAHDSVSAGYIFDQDLEPGSTVKYGSTITLFISSGKSTVILENVVGMEWSKAEPLLRKFTCHISYIDNYGGNVANTISEISLVPGNTYEVGQDIWIKIYSEVITTTEPPTTEPESSSEDVTDDTTESTEDTTSLLEGILGW
ncbi:MAG: PASTA domain-containing protein [Clostridia bacterium]|nr:PASTA domain-containing protein [Clostridia bacterium]